MAEEKKEGGEEVASASAIQQSSKFSFCQTEQRRSATLDCFCLRLGNIDEKQKKNEFDSLLLLPDPDQTGPEGRGNASLQVQRVVFLHPV